MNDEQDIVSALLLSFLIMPPNSCSITLAEIQVGIRRGCLKMLGRLVLFNVQLARVESHVCACR